MQRHIGRWMSLFFQLMMASIKKNCVNFTKMISEWSNWWSQRQSVDDDKYLFVGWQRAKQKEARLPSANDFIVYISTRYKVKMKDLSFFCHTSLSYFLLSFYLFFILTINAFLNAWHHSSPPLLRCCWFY